MRSSSTSGRCGSTATGAGRPTGSGLFALTPEAVEHVYSNVYKPDLIRPGRSNLIPWDIDRARNVVRVREPVSKVHPLEFPARPMLGCIGVAPAGDFAPTSAPSGSYGGNLDYNRIGEGATVYPAGLPPAAACSSSATATHFRPMASRPARASRPRWTSSSPSTSRRRPA